MPPELELDKLEAHLAGTLKPVVPPRRFIRGLRGRIHFPPREEIVLRLRDWNRWIFVLGGVMSGVLVILTTARALFHLFGRRNIA
ncbi:MAG: hypothetical protein MUO77_19840 [Anaerolineales bacterium]|nr:hypothetical protein [Anaerolineales bacterium]